MEWTKDAADAVKRVPFFIRKRVRARIEAMAAEAGKNIVTMDDVNAARKRYLNNMESEIKGYSVSGCFGQSGCPNRISDDTSLMESLEKILAGAGLYDFLKKRIDGPLKFHHEFRLSLSSCPNACSQPQIADLGIIGAAMPLVKDEPCSGCGACLKSCIEDAVRMPESEDGSGGKVAQARQGNGLLPEIINSLCVKCGACAAKCPTGTIVIGKKGYRILLGGRLGRHPRLADELGGIHSAKTVCDVVSACIAFYKENAVHGERFADIVAKNPGSVMNFIKPVVDVSSKEGKD